MYAHYGRPFLLFLQYIFLYKLIQLCFNPYKELFVDFKIRMHPSLVVIIWFFLFDFDLTLKNQPNEMIFCIYVEEIKLFNVLKFHQISSSGLVIIMGQKSTKIWFLFFADLYEVKMPDVRIT